MAQQNGSTPPVPSQLADPQIPIIGQAFKLHCVIPTVMATCLCDRKEPLLLVGMGATVVCPGCKKAYVLRAFAGDQATGNMTANIDIGIAHPLPEA